MHINTKEIKKTIMNQKNLFVVKKIVCLFYKIPQLIIKIKKSVKIKLIEYIAAVNIPGIDFINLTLIGKYDSIEFF